MSLGSNLQFLRKLNHAMTQEALAEKMGVSRQTVSKWELDITYPEMDKVIELCELFSCTMDQLVREEMFECNEAYTDFRIEKIPGFSYVTYNVVSTCPEDDSMNHLREYAKQHQIENPVILGHDFLQVSLEQNNVFHMHGYTAVLIIPEEHIAETSEMELCSQKPQKYAIITIKDPFKSPFKSPFSVIPNAYKTLLVYIGMNGLEECKDSEVISCFERVYEKHGVCYMDVAIAV